MRLFRALPAIAAALPGLAALPAAACRQALVIALDVSASVDAAEYRLQAQGMAAALTAPPVAAAFLDGARPVALAVFLWSGPGDQALVADWTLIDSAATLRTLAARIAAHPRRVAFDGRTAIGSALEVAHGLLQTAPPCDRQTVDLASDGRSNAGPDPQAVSDSSRLAGVTTNALAIGSGVASARASLADYLRLRVTRGPDSFVELAADYADFRRAMTRKLERALQGMVLGAAERRARVSRRAPPRPDGSHGRGSPRG
jgi:hypothetical protein